MILPQTYLVTLIVAIFGMLCMGSWAATLKLGGKWRFELYYFDFAVGVLAVALLLAFTVGNVGYDGFSVMDDISHAGKRQLFYGFVAGIIFNFANMLLAASISVAGMSVAFPLGIGTSVLVAAMLNLFVRKNVNSMLTLAGCFVIVLAMAVTAFAYNALLLRRHEEQARAGKARSTRRPSAFKGVILSIVSGLLMGVYAPLIQSGMAGELGLGPYSIGMLFAIGVFISTFVFNMFFINLAVEGDPVEIGDYFGAPLKTHFLGLSGGILWTLGFTGLLVAGAVPREVHMDPAVGYLMNQFFAVIAALWGLLVWREFKGADAKTHVAMLGMLGLYVGGLLLLAISPLYIRAG